MYCNTFKKAFLIIFLLNQVIVIKISEKWILLKNHGKFGEFSIPLL
jgi:hypothetical protein